MKSAGIIVVRPWNWAMLVDPEDASVDSPNGPPNDDNKMKNLEQRMDQKMEAMIRHVNMFMVCVVSVVFGSVVMYALMK